MLKSIYLKALICLNNKKNPQIHRKSKLPIGVTFCLFGYQANPGENPYDLNCTIDQGQFHTCGFTEELIRFYLNEDGYQIKELFKYDGRDTPSIYLEAEK